MEKKFTKKELKLLKSKLDPDEYRQLIYISFPSIWMETYLVDPKDFKRPLKLRGYQQNIIDHPANKKILRLGRQVGKCVAGETMIQLADGSKIEAKALSGKHPIEIISLDPTTLRLTTDMAEVTPNGIRATYKLSTKGGHSTTVTNNHPFLIVDNNNIPDWVHLKKLSIDDKLAIPADINKIEYTSKHAPIVTKSRNDYLDALYSGDIRWDAIANIEYVSEQETYSLYVEKTHNFIGDGIISHNTFQMCGVILQQAATMGQSKVLVVCPMEAHVKNIFDSLRYQIDHSPYLMSIVLSMTKRPLEIVLRNGSTIVGFTAGVSSGGRGMSVRGQRASSLFVDEADYIGNETMEAILATTMAYSKDPFIWLSSTPTGKRDYFYDAYYSQQYTTWHYPSSISPDWTKEKETFYKSHYTALGYTHEFEADWGGAESGVFPIWALEKIANNSLVMSTNGTLDKYTYGDIDRIVRLFKTKIMGVDWNKTWGTRIVLCGMDDYKRLFVIGKWIIDASEFTQHHGVNKIIELNRRFDPKYIMVDEGFGCVGPTTLIHTPSGVKCARNIEQGDEVLTQSGKYHKVLATILTPPKETYLLKPAKCLETVISDTHPCLIYRSKSKKRFTNKVKESDLIWLPPSEINKETDFIVLPKEKHDFEQPNAIIDLTEYIENVQYDDRYIWNTHSYSSTLELSATTLSNYARCGKATVTRIRRAIREKKELTEYQKKIATVIDDRFGEKWREIEQIKFKRYIDVTSIEFQNVLGWYISEGYCGSNCIEVCQKSQNHTKEFSQFIKNANKLFPSVSIEYRNNDVIRVTIMGKIAANIFKVFGGSHANGKRIHPYLIKFPCKELLRSIIHGDGYINKKIGYIQLSFTSFSLTTQIRQMFVNEGILPSLYKWKPQNQNCAEQLKILINGGKTITQKINRFLGVGIRSKINQRDRRKYIETENYILVPIDKLEKAEVRNDLIDLSIEGDHTFVGNGFILHNTMQLEDLRLTGLKFPESGLHDKVFAVPTGSHIQIKDIVTGGQRSTPAKNFIVESTVRMIEREAIMFPIEEHLTTKELAGKTSSNLTIIDQMRNYYVKNYTATGRPIYMGSNDHDLDALMFCVYGLVTQISSATNPAYALPIPRPSVMKGDVLMSLMAKGTKELEKKEQIGGRQIVYSDKPENSESVLKPIEQLKKMRVKQRYKRRIGFSSLRKRR